MTSTSRRIGDTLAERQAAARVLAVLATKHGDPVPDDVQVLLAATEPTEDDDPSNLDVTTDAFVALGELADRTNQAVAGHTAVEWWTYAANSGNTDAMVHLGRQAGFRQKDQKDTAVMWLTRAAEAGNTDAMVLLGQGLRPRLRRSPSPSSEGWLVRAAEAGNTDAMVQLGRLARNYQRAHGIAGATSASGWWNHAMAANRTAYDWWAAAAEFGNSDAMIELGDLADQAGRKINGRTDVEWWTQAARAGNTAAMNRLAERAQGPALVSGRTAAGWLMSAAERGDMQALHRLRRLAEASVRERL